ncbi:MAG: hypothetical protein ABSE49_20455 [Polyangiaceae bacterium]
MSNDSLARLRWPLALAAASAATAGAVVLACSGGNGGGGVADAGEDGSEVTRHAEDSAMEDASGDDGGCEPRAVDGGAPFVPPIAPRSACTAAQIQALYDDCWGDGGASSCAVFEGDPANASCVACMVTPSTASQWGAIVTFPNGLAIPNVSGCIALVATDDAGPPCAAAVQSADLCEQASCALHCPSASTAAGLAEFQQCEDQAATSTCETDYLTAMCYSDEAYSDCVFPTMGDSFVGLGQVFCAGALPDASPGTD